MKEVELIDEKLPEFENIDQKMEYANNLKKIYDAKTNPAFRESLEGPLYKGKMDQFKGGNPGKLSIGRSAGYSITVLALLLEKDKAGNPKYTFEEICDPNAFVEEKQKMFDKYIKATLRGNDEDKKLIHETLTNGLKRGSEVVSDYASRLNLDDPNYEYSPSFQKLAGLSVMMHDAWQELDANYSKEQLDFVQREAPDIKTKDEAHDYMLDKYIGMMTEFANDQYKIMNGYQKIKNNNPTANPLSVVTGAFMVNEMKKLVEDWRENDIPLTEYSLKKQGRTFYHNLEGAFTGSFLNDDWIDTRFDDELSQQLVKHSIQGTLFKGSSYEIKNEELNVINPPILDSDNSKVILPKPVKVEKKAAKSVKTAKEDFTKYGFTSLDPNAVKKNAKLIGELYKLIDGNNTWGGSKNNNYKNTLSKLKELKELSEKYAKHGMVLGEPEMVRYRSLANDVDKLAEKYLAEKTDINSPYAQKRVDGMKKLRNALKANVAPLKEAAASMKEAVIKEVFGDVNKTYNETDPWRCDNNAFYGQKYADPKTRELSNNGFSLQRSGALSISIFALAATGKYTMDELMDNSKLRAEKAAMYDTVAEHIKNSAPGNEHSKWIAEQIYKGQIATEKMIEDTAKTVDFSNPNIRQNKTFCQMLHLTLHQQDAWQEMAHCQNEIFEIAKHDHPEMNSWNDYKKWWTGRNTPLRDINDAMNKQQNAAVEMMTHKENLDNTASILVLQGAFIKKTLKSLADLQKSEAKDKPMRDWIPREKKMENLALASAVGQQELKGKFRYLDNDPKFSQLVTKGIVDGTLLKNVEMSMDMTKGKAKITGFPSKEEMKEYADNQKFLKKTDMALDRLKAGKYKSVDSFIKDSAYAIFGQMYRMSGNRPPIDAKTGKKLTLEEYAAKKIRSKDFQESLRSNKNPSKFVKPSTVVKMATNEESMRKIIETNKKEALRYTNAKKGPTINAPVKEPKAQNGVPKVPNV
ncbi:MAG: hypothetical protein J5517_04810 [Eubacterium sp.]|nr:hypothetical protein [Eubacterium sp.]